MYELKTKLSDDSVTKFLDNIDDEIKREDCFAIAGMMEQATKLKAKMWGAAIVGFGSYHYKYESGHEGDMCLIGFSPRKQNITLYIISGITDQQALLHKLGKFKVSKGCLYIKKLSDVDTTIFKKLIKISFDNMKKKYT